MTTVRCSIPQAPQHTGVEVEVDFTYWQWLFPLAVTLHNLEEAIWLPAWSRSAGRWQRVVHPGAFRFAVAVLTLLAYLVAWWSVEAGSESVGTYLLTGYAVAMLLNVAVPHLIASLALRRYMPGLGTALLLNLPVTVCLLVSAVDGGYVHFPLVAYTGAGVTVVLLASIPPLLAIGQNLSRRISPSAAQADPLP